MGFLGKLSTFIKGQSHDLLDKAIDMNSPSMLRQYARDLEAGIADVKQQAIIQTAAVSTLKREIGTKELELTKTTNEAKQIQASSAANRDTLLTSKALVAVSVKKTLESLNTDLVHQQEVADQMNGAVTQLDAKHTTVLARIHELERLDSQTKAKVKASKAVDQVGKILSDSVGSDSIDNLESKMREKNDVANAKFDASMGTLQTPDPTQDAAVADFLKEIKE